MFVIKCNSCNWLIKTAGNKKELQELKLKEISNGCANCGKIRKFICQKCGQVCKMYRMK